MVVAADLSELVDARHRRVHRHAESETQCAPRFSHHSGRGLRQHSGRRDVARPARRCRRGRGASAAHRRRDPQGWSRPPARGREVPRVQHRGGNRGVEAALGELRPGMAGIDVDTAIYRPASFIERATDNLSSAILIAAVLAVVALVVLAAVLGSWRMIGGGCGLHRRIAGRRRSRFSTCATSTST